MTTIDDRAGVWHAPGRANLMGEHTDNARVLAAVDLLRSAPADPGVYYKIGGGFGGSVLALVPSDAATAVRTAVAHAFTFHGWAAPEFIETVPSGGASRVDIPREAG
jgi:galactokinase